MAHLRQCSIMGWTNNRSSDEDYDGDDEDVQVPVGYYWATLANANVYEKDGDVRLALSFENLENVAGEDYSEVDGVEVDVPMFMPANVSYQGKETYNSDLVNLMQSLGLADALFRALGNEDPEEGDKFVPQTDDEKENLEVAIEAVFDSKEFKIDVNDLGDDASVVDKIADYREA